MPAHAYPILEFFEYEHLPPRLQTVSKPFCETARHMAAYLPEHPETEACLRKLLEAKDCAVRAELVSTRHDAAEAASDSRFRPGQKVRLRRPDNTAALPWIGVSWVAPLDQWDQAVVTLKERHTCAGTGTVHAWETEEIVLDNEQRLLVSEVWLEPIEREQLND